MVTRVRIWWRGTCALLVALLWWASVLSAQTSVRFAIVGDYGDTPPNSGNVAALIQRWNPDFIVTTGDNNYTNPTPNPPDHYPSWDGAVGQYYHQFIAFPAGSGSSWAGSGSTTNNFYPSLGNHDWDAGIAGWYSYFAIPGNERYFDFVRGPVHFFVIDSDGREPDGNTSGSAQGQWLQAQLALSTAQWKIVIFHHPPYTSASRGNNVALQWPFQSWGANAVLNGHEHQYERIMKNGFPYIVSGAGGRSLSGFGTIEAGSAVRYSANYGAVLAEADGDSVVFRFYSISGGSGGTLIDRYVLRSSIPVPVQLASFTVVPLKGSRLRLEWTTLTETQNYGFRIQKSPVFPVKYSTIPNSFIGGHGTTIDPHAYVYVDSGVMPGAWFYRLMQLDLDGTAHYSESVRADIATEVRMDGAAEFALQQNYPNPFNAGTSIRFHLGKPTSVTLKIYSLLGSEVLTIFSEASMGPGPYAVNVIAPDLPSGLYLYRLTTSEFAETRKMLLIK